MQYILSDRLYQLFKWLVVLVIPAATTLYVTLAPIWGWPLADEVAKTSASVCTFLGVVLGISQVTAKPIEELSEC